MPIVRGVFVSVPGEERPGPREGRRRWLVWPEAEAWVGRVVSGLLFLLFVVVGAGGVMGV